MLADRDIAYIRGRFGIYDHEWSYYAPTLGEPYLIDDFLVYFDGVFVYICAFSFADLLREASNEEILRILDSRPEFSAAHAICVWGRFEHIDFLSLPGSAGGPVLPCISFDDYDPLFVNLSVDVRKFSYTAEREARLARNAVYRSGLKVEVRRRDLLSAEHLALVTEWRNTHDVSPVHVGALHALAGYVRAPHVYLVECRREGNLVGFAVVSVPGDRIVVFVQGFSRRNVGRVGDALHAEMIAFATERDVECLHMGYSVAPSLARFKRKWAARIDGPPFREAFFTRSTVLSSLIREGEYRWQQRLSCKEAIPLSWGGA